jgi:hypothetical protein
VQQSCLDSIGESLKRNRENIAELKDKIDKNSSTCKNLASANQSYFVNTTSSVEKNGANILELNRKMQASISALKNTESSLRPEIQDITLKVTAVHELDACTTAPHCTCSCGKAKKSEKEDKPKEGCTNQRYDQNSHRDYPNKQDPQVSALLSMNNAIWKENQELRRELKLYQKSGGIWKQESPTTNLPANTNEEQRPNQPTNLSSKIWSASM